jgi:intracellular septation protein
MKLLLDFLPLLLFFGTFKFADRHKEAAAAWATQHFGGIVSGGAVSATQAPVLLATIVVILATIVQVALVKLSGRKIDRLLWITLGIVVVLGGATVWLNDETFIKWKPTVYNWVLATVMLVTQFVFRRDPLKAVMGTQMKLPESVWGKLSVAYALFFIALGALNLYVAFHYPTDTWVDFKVFVLTGLMIVFVVVQAFWLSRYIEDDTPPAASSTAQQTPPPR